MLESTNPEYSSNQLLFFLYKWRKPLIIITLSAFVVSVIASYIITPKYKSTAIIFPTQANSVSRLLLEENIDLQKDLVSFGQDEEVEQTLQILISDEIRNLLVEKYDLMRHYDINPDEPLSKTYLKEEYESAVNIRPTEYLSIRIEVSDKNPDTASMIANDVVAFLDSVKSRMDKERAKQAFSIIKKEYNSILSEAVYLKDSMDKFRTLGVYDYFLQVEAYSKGYAKAIAQGNNAGALQLENKLKIFDKYGGQYLLLKERLYIIEGRIRVVKSRYDQTLADMNNFIPYSFFVNKATPSQKKATPVRWLIVIISTVLAFISTIVAIITIEKFSKIKFQ